MNRDEILAKSRTENLGQDERDLHDTMRAGRSSMVFGAALCFAMVFLKILLNDALDIVSYTCYAIYGGMGCFHYLWLAIRLKKPLYWVAVGVCGLLFIASSILFVMELCK